MAGFSSPFIDIEIEYFDECEERLKRLFDQALLVFLEEDGKSKPLPVVLGDGKKVDLFKLFVLVRERKGSDTVSRKGLWELVAEKLGLDCSVSPSLRLIYSKYLESMEKWAVGKSRIVNWDNQNSKKKGCYGGLLHELGNGFKVLLQNGKCQKRNRAVVFGCKHIEESGSELCRKRFRESCRDSFEEGVEMSCVVLSDESDVCAKEEVLDFSLVKQGDLPEMLKWLTLVARCPHDPSIGVIPHLLKWKKFTGNKCWIQVIRAKNALLIQRDNPELRYQNSPLLGHQTMHPSIYEDDRKSTGRLRYSIRRPNLSKHRCNGSLVSLTRSGYTNCRKLINACKITALEKADLAAGTSGAGDLQVYSNGITEPNKPEIPRRYVAVGRNFQAQVGQWTGPSLDSDTKWFGTRIWPLQNEESLDTLGNDMIGKGRPDCCSCDVLLSGSVECTRFHIAEKRMELKRDLREVFFHWRFNQMGEEVSLRWTEREEKKFKDMMISDPESFWKKAAKCFGLKKREQLVSYYFNVFLINRRRYQNRTTPKHIDSDDDEEAFGCVGSSFGRDAVTSFGSDIMICSENRQCDDFD